MDEVFGLTAPPGSLAEDEEADDDEELEFIFTGPATGWTEEDTRILEAALDLAGITDAAGRLQASMAVDLLDIVNLAPLVKTAQGLQALIAQYRDKIKGGIGR